MYRGFQLQRLWLASIAVLVLSTHLCSANFFYVTRWRRPRTETVRTTETRTLIATVTELETDTITKTHPQCTITHVETSRTTRVSMRTSISLRTVTQTKTRTESFTATETSTVSTSLYHTVSVPKTIYRTETAIVNDRSLEKVNNELFDLVKNNRNRIDHVTVTIKETQHEHHMMTRMQTTTQTMTERSLTTVISTAISTLSLTEKVPMTVSVMSIKFVPQQVPVYAPHPQQSRPLMPRSGADDMVVTPESDEPTRNVLKEAEAVYSGSGSLKKSDGTSDD